MNKILKKITAYSLIVLAGFAAVTALLHCFDLIEYYSFEIYFGSESDGSASNTPILFGLIMIGACYLLVNSDRD